MLYKLSDLIQYFGISNIHLYKNIHNNLLLF
jgi:hypothetical protein